MYYIQAGRLVFYDFKFHRNGDGDWPIYGIEITLKYINNVILKTILLIELYSS